MFPQAADEKTLQKKHVWTYVSRKFALLGVGYRELSFTVVNDPFTTEKCIESV